MSCPPSEYECPLNFEDLYALEKAIVKGVKEVQYNDKKVVYNSIDDMLKAANYVRIKLGLKKGASKNKGLFGGKRLTMKYDKGLNNCSSDTSEHGEDERFDRNDC